MKLKALILIAIIPLTILMFKAAAYYSMFLSSTELNYPQSKLAYEVSPDGKLLALVTNKDLIIWSSNLKTKIKTYNLPKNSLGYNPAIYWAPDSKHLALGLRMQGEKSGLNRNIYLLNIEDDSKELKFMGSDYQWLTWSPDSLHFSVDKGMPKQRRSYIVDIREPNKIKQFAPNYNILIYDWLSEKEVVYVLVRNKEYLLGVSDLQGNQLNEISSYIQGKYSVSNKKDKIAYHFNNPTNGFRSIGFYSLIDRKTTISRELEIYSRYVYWSPDDTKIAYFTYPNRFKEVWVSNINNNEDRKIFETKTEGITETGYIGPEEIKWLSNGSKIAFIYHKSHMMLGEKSYLVIYDLATRKLSKKRFPVGYPTDVRWSPDDSKLFFTNKTEEILYKYDIKLD